MSKILKKGPLDKNETFLTKKRPKIEVKNGKGLLRDPGMRAPHVRHATHVLQPAGGHYDHPPPSPGSGSSKTPGPPTTLCALKRGILSMFPKAKLLVFIYRKPWTTFTAVLRMFAERFLL